jgi:hypothetical protein
LPRTGPIDCQVTAVSAFLSTTSMRFTPNLPRGAKVLKPPQDYAYGMRDFDVVDLDGNQLTFGMGTDSV